MERKLAINVQASRALPVRCFLAGHMNSSLTFLWHSEQAAGVGYSPKSKLSTMCRVGIWSHGEAPRDPALCPLSFLFTQVRPHGPYPKAHSLPDHKAWYSHKQQDRANQPVAPLCGDQEHLPFLLLQSLSPHNSSPIQFIPSITECSPV